MKYEWAETVRMAIKALEQEPCEDCISREAVENVIKHAEINFTVNSDIDFTKHKREVQEIVNGIIDAQIKALRDLPSVTSQPCDDCVSRQELLKAIATWDKFGCDADTKLVPYKDHYVPYIHYDDVINCIKGTPPVTPQQKVGWWIRTIGENGVTSALRCSKCGFEDNRYELFNYCPKCGAKMQKVE